MIKEALEYLVGLPTYREQIGGVEYSDKKLIAVTPPVASPLVFQRLQGFADFVLAAKRDALSPDETMIHVISPWEVNYFSVLNEVHRFREHYAHAVMAKDRGFVTGQWKGPEEFVIALQTLFDEDGAGERARLLELAGNVSAEFVNTSEDDGVTQNVGVKAGVRLVKRRAIDNPFNLQPHRTFPEITQPTSPFILRARQSTPDAPPMLALFECDNGAWEIDALANIQEWLSSKLKETGVPILA